MDDLIHPNKPLHNIGQSMSQDRQRQLIKTIGKRHKRLKVSKYLVNYDI